MNGNCFEIGTIQAFLDGELSADKSVRLTDHVASCDACARLMADADEENSFVFSALERELDTLVPTQRLWSRINDGIAVEKSRAPWWEKVFAYVRINLANPSVVAAAGILLVLGALTAVVLVRDSATYRVFVGTEPAVPTERPVNGPTVAPPVSEPAPASAKTKNPGAPAPMQAAADESKLSQKEVTALAASVKEPKRKIVPQYAFDTNVPGEESYVKTIADLKQNVDSQKETVMNPSSRVSYERDMAVVNDSIKRMRDVVKKNPRNQAARQVLYSSYQDKIDLLNSVAQREELLVSLR